jgi:hypothetical protein
MACITAWLIGRRQSQGKGLDPNASAWWVVFSADDPDTKDATRNVTVHLNNGTVISGNLQSFSRAADEIKDRDLVLQSPLYMQPARSKRNYLLPSASMVLSARDIKIIEVEYVRPLEDNE